MKDLEIADEIASARLIEVIELHKLHQSELMSPNVGKTMSVLFENLKPNGEISGFTDNYCQVYVKGSDELLGCIADVKIISSTRTTFKGEVVK